jgi:hypothetical protein|tara:strand:+ start:70 stop:204 length:135 start_codon:yes stop_codon:yes gene_type:complete
MVMKVVKNFKKEVLNCNSKNHGMQTGSGRVVKKNNVMRHLRLSS